MDGNLMAVSWSLDLSGLRVRDPCRLPHVPPTSGYRTVICGRLSVIF